MSEAKAEKEADVSEKPEGVCGKPTVNTQAFSQNQLAVLSSDVLLQDEEADGRRSRRKSLLLATSLAAELGDFE